MTHEELVEALNAALDARRSINGEEHATHHAFVRNLIRCAERRREILDKVMQHVLGWSTVLGVGWLGAQILKAVRGGSGG